MKKNVIKPWMFIVLSIMMLTGVLSANEKLDVYAAKEEKLPEDMKFLMHLDEKEFALWDDELGELTDAQAAEMKSYLETYIIKGETKDYNQAKLIYDWIYENVKYAANPAEAAYINPYDIFIHRAAVCGGFSNLYKAFLNLAEIPSVLIAGNTPVGGHMWNVVYAGEKWFYSDVTWGNEYFDKGVSEFLLDHSTQRVENVTVEMEDGVLIGYDTGLAVVGTTNGMEVVNTPDMFEDLEVTSVSYQLFHPAYGVEILNIGKNITTIDSNTESDTLEIINVSKDNENFISHEGALFTSDLSRLLIYPKAKKDTSFTLPKETGNLDTKESLDNQYLTDIWVEEGNSSYASYEGALYDADKKTLLMVPLGKTEVHVYEDAEIDGVAFANADTGRITIVAKEGSAAHEYALQNGIAFRVEGAEVFEPVTEVFEDVTEGKWYVSYVQYVYDKGLMSGNNGLFNPTKNVTRAQIVTTLYRMEGTPEVKDYRACEELLDVEMGQWYTDAVCWAYNTGVTTGNTSTKMFNVNTPVTREQLATFFYRYADYKKLDVTARGDYSFMLNAHEVKAYSAEAVSWAVGEGLISGSEMTDENGRPAKDLAPQAGATRAQLAAILQRFCEKNNI